MKKNKRNPKKNRGRLCFLLSLLQILISAFLIYSLHEINILPAKYFLAVVAVLILCGIFTIKKSFTSMVSHGRRRVGLLSPFISVILIILSVPASYYILSADKMISNITSPAGSSADISDENFVSIITLKDSSLSLVTELDGLNLGIDNSFDADKMNYSVKWLEKKYDINCNSENYTNLRDFVDNLYNGSLDAIILESSRYTLMENLSETFTDDTKIIARIAVDYSEYNNSTASEPVATLPPRPDGNIADGGSVTDSPFIVYVSGIDTSGSIALKSRSDTNILMAVNPRTKKILLVSTPRDTYTPLYGVSGSVKDKLTHAGLYGPECSMGTLETLYDISIDYYIRVNFSSVIDIVDALGGVDVYSAYSFTSQNTSGYSFTKGYNHVNGAAALSFCRERYSFGNGDYQRGQNHIEMIKAVINKACSPAILGNFDELMEAVSSCVQTSLSADELTSLVKMQLNDGASWEFESMALTNTGSSSSTCYSLPGPSLYVGIIDEDSRQEISRAFDEFMTE